MQAPCYMVKMICHNSAKTALQGSEAESRELLELLLQWAEHSRTAYSQRDIIGLPSRQTNDFFSLCGLLIFDCLCPHNTPHHNVHKKTFRLYAGATNSRASNCVVRSGAMFSTICLRFLPSLVFLTSPPFPWMSANTFWPKRNVQQNVNACWWFLN